MIAAVAGWGWAGRRQQTTWRAASVATLRPGTMASKQAPQQLFGDLCFFHQPSAEHRTQPHFSSSTSVAVTSQRSLPPGGSTRTAARSRHLKLLVLVGKR